MSHIKWFTILFSILLISSGCDTDTKSYAYDTGDQAATIRVLFLYEKNAGIQTLKTHGSLLAKAVEYLDFLNGVLERSGISHELALAKHPTTGEPVTGSLLHKVGKKYKPTSLHYILEQPGVSESFRSVRLFLESKEGIQDVRDEVNADIVIVMFAGPFPSEISTGNSDVTYGDEEEDWEGGFAVVRHTNTRTLYHETGHLLGADHDRGAEGQECEEDPIYRCAIVRPEKNIQSAVAYDDVCVAQNGEECREVFAYSNPYLEWFNEDNPTGVVLGNIENNYNACAIEQLGNYIADFSKFQDGMEYYERPLWEDCDEYVVGPPPHGGPDVPTE